MKSVPQIIISASQVGKQYVNGAEAVWALQNVSFEVRQGEFVAVMGPSGSGKSTLMNLIGALDVPTAGTLRICGSETRSLSPKQLADLRSRTLGFVFQDFNLLPNTTALRQVMLPLLYARPRCPNPEVVASMGLHEVGVGGHAHRLPQQLSGGQQQRVAIARALVNRPSVLLADEPTGSLDRATAQDIMGVLRSLNERGVTLVIVTHDERVAECADRRIVLNSGKIVERTLSTPASFARKTRRR